jgi:hypothetical protein
MKKTRKKARQKSVAFASWRMLIIVVLLLLSIPFTIYLAQNEQSVKQSAQIATTPPFFCEGSCPSIEPSQGALSNPGISIMPSTNAAPDVSTAPDVNTPCPNNDNAVAADNDRHSRRHNGGGIQQIFEFILQLLQKLIELLTGGSSGNPAQNEPVPSQSVEPEQPEQPDMPSEAPANDPNNDPNNAPDQQPQPSMPCNPPESTLPEPSAPINMPETGPSGAPAQEAPSAAVSSAPAAPGAPADVPATTDTCSGKYKLTNPRGQNFGDPQCNFDKNTLYTQLKQSDAANADIWFNEVVPCESAYNPNAYAPPTTGTPDAGGAWGLFQMGQGKNGQSDHGDVVWGMQAANAVNYNTNVIGGNWRYWACAKAHWK